MKLVFSGPVKNCEKNLRQNLEYILNLTEYSNEISIKIYVIEGDSIDSTKKILNDFCKYQNMEIFHEDGLMSKIPNRVERIAHCRNFLLEKISASKIDFDIYIPLDLDVDLFKFIKPNELISKLESFKINESVDAIFPYSRPYYYDLAALRAENWINEDVWIKFNRLSKKIKIGKIFLRIFLIFNNQKKPPKKNQLIPVESAFGGIGIYKFRKINFKSINYGTTPKDLSADHIVFNTGFKNKFIDTNWYVLAPHEHIEFKTLSLINKLKYIYKELSIELKVLLNNITGKDD